MDNRKRRKLIITAISKAVSSLGFKNCSGDYFSRRRGVLLDCFFFQETRSQFRFEITYGIDRPEMLARLTDNKTLNSNSSQPRLWITPHTGRLGPYGCKHEEHIENSVTKINSDIQSNAIPWLEQVTTAEDLVDYYRIAEVREDQPSTPPPSHSGLRRGIYGMMLADIGKHEAARDWLATARTAWQSTPQSPERTEWLTLIEATIQSID